MPLFMTYLVRIAGGAFIVLLLIDGFAGCKVTDQELTPAYNGVFFKETYDGHSYVCREYFRQVTMVHDPDCPCQKK